MSAKRMSNRATAQATGSQKQVLFLGTTLSRLRWIIIATSLCITVIWPVQGRLGHSIWQLILLFACYNAVIEIVRRFVPQQGSFAWVPLLDLLAVAVIYYLDYDPGGPTFVYFYLALISAAGTMSLRRTVLYTGAVVATVAVLAPTLPGWSVDHYNIRQLSSRLVVMALMGIGTAILSRRLALEYEQRRSVQLEASRLEELDRLRNEFIASISHDLFTPLTAVRAGLGMLEAQEPERRSPEAQRLWTNVRRNVERLDLLIGDLLTLNQIKAGALHLDREPIDLRVIVADALAGVHSLVVEKGQTIEADLAEALPIEGDPRRLEQAIMNLLINAHRHTPGGTRIEIGGRCNDDRVLLSVRDNGPGIAPEELDAIFARFQRGASPAPGSGLGLATARSLVELHGGRLWAESAEHQGATFHITLPRRAEGLGAARAAGDTGNLSSDTQVLYDR
jgi:signal transduction histidine kinase